jgi:tripartite-type tricarboxylate transporter receptor subunit TctC
MMRFLVFLALLVPSVAFSQYPNKAIRMIVPFAPGGASDIGGRHQQPPPYEQDGHQEVVENPPGATGQIGRDEAAHAAPRR